MNSNTTISESFLSTIEDAIDDFRQALQLNPNLAEAYFNLGLTYIFSGNKAEGLKNLSKAGELGLYDAYSLIKRYGEK